ncbi:MAG: hypothetical protein ACR2PT_00690, partial [Endozoicomonas sp.]
MTTICKAGGKLLCCLCSFLMLAGFMFAATPAEAGRKLPAWKLIIRASSTKQGMMIVNSMQSTGVNVVQQSFLQGDTLDIYNQLAPADPLGVVSFTGNEYVFLWNVVFGPHHFLQRPFANRPPVVDPIRVLRSPINPEAHTLVIYPSMANSLPAEVNTGAVVSQSQDILILEFLLPQGQYFSPPLSSEPGMIVLPLQDRWRLEINLGLQAVPRIIELFASVDFSQQTSGVQSGQAAFSALPVARKKMEEPPSSANGEGEKDGSIDMALLVYYPPAGTGQEEYFRFSTHMWFIQLGVFSSPSATEEGGSSGAMPMKRKAGKKQLGKANRQSVPAPHTEPVLEIDQSTGQSAQVVTRHRFELKFQPESTTYDPEKQVSRKKKGRREALMKARNWDSMTVPVLIEQVIDSISATGSKIKPGFEKIEDLMDKTLALVEVRADLKSAAPFQGARTQLQRIGKKNMEVDIDKLDLALLYAVERVLDYFTPDEETGLVTG